MARFQSHRRFLEISRGLGVGVWRPDGLLTPPSDEAMLYDIQYLRDAVFNMIRKHIKVEPRRYYYHCDRLGMLVWTPFNEAWVQHRTMEVGKWTVQRDSSRLVNIASGGNSWPVGGIADHHEYPHPAFPFDAQDWSDYVKVVGEFGGHGLPVKGHLYDEQRDNWGYGGLPKNAEEYLDRYRESIRRLDLFGIVSGRHLDNYGGLGDQFGRVVSLPGNKNGCLEISRQPLGESSR